MHIAVCMDNAADRKQLERLLGRSTDRRIAEDESFPFYIQSYGNKEALLRRPNMYDLFFIDLLNDDLNSVELIRELRHVGVTATVVYCPNTVDLQDRLLPEDDVIILKQPIMVVELEKVIDIAVAEVRSRVPKIELRTTRQTVKILPESLLYVEKKKDGTQAHLADGTMLEMTERMENVGQNVETFDGLVYLPDNLIVNINYVNSIGFGSVKLKNGLKYKVKREGLKKLEALMKKSN